MQDHSLEWKSGPGAGFNASARLIRLTRPAACPQAFLGLILALALWPGQAAADLATPDPSRFFPIRDLLGGLWPGGRPTVFEQRAIQDKKKPPERPKPPEGETPSPPQEPAATTPEAQPPAKEAILSPTEEKAKYRSPTRAFLLSAAVPGLGELYSGSNRGYLFLGVEAVSWISFASYHASSNNKEDEMFAFADDHFSIDAFEHDCVSQPGQLCSNALDDLRGFYETNRDEYYEIISKNPIYRPGWGVRITDSGFIYENCDPNDPPGTCPPPVGSDAYRQWVANQAAAQDQDYAHYNVIRDDRNSLSRTARGMTMVALVNHVVSAWDAFMAARGVNAVAHGLQAEMAGDIQMDLKFKGSLDNPGAVFVLRREF